MNWRSQEALISLAGAAVFLLVMLVFWRSEREMDRRVYHVRQFSGGQLVGDWQACDRIETFGDNSIRLHTCEGNHAVDVMGEMVIERVR